MNNFIIKYFLNPSIALAFALLAVLGSTFLGWSDLFEVVSNETIYIYLLSSLFLLIIGLFSSAFLSKNYLNGSLINSFNSSNKSSLIFVIICLLFIFEVLYSGWIPAFKVYSDVLDSSFGIPLFHGVFLAYISYRSVVYFQQYISTSNKKYFLFVVVINLMFILLARRGAIVFHFIAYAFLYIYVAGIRRKIGLRIIGFSLIAISAFGLFFNYMGNKRLAKTDNEYILTVGKASEEFMNSYMPESLFFAYLYVSTPVNVFDNNRINHDLSITDYLFENIIPDFITKRLGYSSDVKLNITNGFTVGGVFTKPYYMMGVAGVILILLFYMLILLLILKGIRKRKKRALTALAMFFSLSLLLTFQNLLNYSGYILPIYMAMFFKDFGVDRRQYG